jgi:predicted NUDIX family NTP pyrophosphohydrolase
MKLASGLLLFRRNDQTVEVLLVHPAGPIWGKKDVWSIPKGEHKPDEDHIAAAFREFEEELGVKPPEGKLIELGSLKANDKENFIWALDGEVNLSQFKSNLFEMEWPPKSGQMQKFPEVDRAEWFRLEVAKNKLFKNQIGFIDRLAEHLGVDLPGQQSLL